MSEKTRLNEYLTFSVTGHNLYSSTFGQFLDVTELNITQ